MGPMQQERLRPLTLAEQRELKTITKASSERLDRVRRAAAGLGGARGGGLEGGASGGGSAGGGAGAELRGCRTRRWLAEWDDGQQPGPAVQSGRAWRVADRGRAGAAAAGRGG